MPNTKTAKTVWAALHNEMRRRKIPIENTCVSNGLLHSLNWVATVTIGVSGSKDAKFYTGTEEKTKNAALRSACVLAAQDVGFAVQDGDK